jgi:hypothetical protein
MISIRATWISLPADRAELRDLRRYADEKLRWIARWRSNQTSEMKETRASADFDWKADTRPCIKQSIHSSHESCRLIPSIAFSR